MKAALIISGYLRSIKLNLSNIKNKIIEKFDHVDVYIHITLNENKQDKYFNNGVSDIDDNEIIKILNPVCILKEYNFEFDDFSYKSLLNTWLKYYKLNSLKKMNEELNGLYDIVIKYRPDLNVISDIDFAELANGVVIPKNTLVDKNKLRSPSDAFVCDVMAFGKSEDMDKYFDFYRNIECLRERYGNVSETLLKKYFDEKNIVYKEIDIDYSVILSECNIFAIAGDSGSGKTTLGNILKNFFSKSFMLECDRYHKWERSDPKWIEYTHLNPNANYISKMNEDIFNLKIGKTIYQVDYDHSNGRFTDQQKIDSSENIIVCGLHSLYSENDSVYNMKIFVDTDINLRTFWKLRRDIKLRGHSYEHVINQIESRKKDYIEFVHPQKYKSDVIINFFTDDDFSIEHDMDANIKLNIYINKKFNIESVLIMMHKNNVEYTISDDSENFFKVCFDKYQPIIFDSRVNMGNFYDYIVSIILNLK